MTSTKVRGRNGPNGKLLITWARIMETLQPPFVARENVVGFDLDALHELLGHIYVISDFQVLM